MLVRTQEVDDISYKQSLSILMCEHSIRNTCMYVCMHVVTYVSM